jgi:hypothetical protein
MKKHTLNQTEVARIIRKKYNIYSVYKRGRTYGKAEDPVYFSASSVRVPFSASASCCLGRPYSAGQAKEL